MQIMCVGGSFNMEGGRPSGYFGKLARALQASAPAADTQVLNGGHYDDLHAAMSNVTQVTHLLWFVDVPNDLPKLLPALKARFPALVLVSSKNNRQGKYSRPQLYERMRRSRSELLVEFGAGEAGAIVSSLLLVQGMVALEASVAVDQVAEALVRQFDRLSALAFPLEKPARASCDSLSYKFRNLALETEIPLHDHVGAFGVTRRNHVHEGVDLYGMPGDAVLAMESGQVVTVAPFTGAAADSPWWAETSCVLVQGASGGLNYGEIKVAPGIEAGVWVVKGQTLGELTPVLLEDKGRPMTMLHLERYSSAAQAPVKEWTLGDEQPDILCDPTMLLLFAAKNQVRAQSARKICIVGERGLVSHELQARLAQVPRFSVFVVSTDSVLSGASKHFTDSADLVVLCTQEFSSPDVMAVLPQGTRVLDVSPAFRTADGWVYGLPEIIGVAGRVANATNVANPGCFATSAILILEPLVRLGLIPKATPLYLDGVGGFTTGGAAMVEKAGAGQVAAEAVFGLNKEHRHIAEIKHVSGLTGPVMFSPKVALVPRGIRMQIPLFGLDASVVRQALAQTYAGTSVVVEEDASSRVAVDDWAGRSGACIRIYDQSGGCLVVCTMDNMGKGAADAAFENILLMLG